MRSTAHVRQTGERVAKVRPMRGRLLLHRVRADHAQVRPLRLQRVQNEGREAQRYEVQDM